MKEITPINITRLNNLKTQADRLNKMLDDIVEEAEAITGESKGIVFDFIMNGLYANVSELLDRLNYEATKK